MPTRVYHHWNQDCGAEDGVDVVPVLPAGSYVLTFMPEEGDRKPVSRTVQVVAGKTLEVVAEFE